MRRRRALPYFFEGHGYGAAGYLSPEDPQEDERARQLRQRQVALEQLAELGKRWAADANPQTYSFETRQRAENHKPFLLVARQCYRKIRAGCDPISSLRQLRAVAASASATAGEANPLSRLIERLMTL
jgi:hypothetical protein